MARGRKSTPATVIQLRGNPGKRAQPENLPRPEIKSQPCPAWVCAKGQEVWVRLMPEMERHGLISALYVDMFAQFCQLVGESQALLAVIKSRGRTYTTSGRNGIQYKTRPEVAQLNEVRRQLRGFGSEFGLSPSANRHLEGLAQGDLFDKGIEGFMNEA